MSALGELETAFVEARADSSFREKLAALLRDYAGRPTPVYLAEGLSRAYGKGIRIYLKREDLNHTGAHKINNCLGQVLLASRMGKSRIVAETGAGQHGVATATVCALFSSDCVIYMGEEDMRRQKANVTRMNLLGATVIPVSSGTRTLKDATNEAIRDWVKNVEDTHYVLGSTVGPHPYPQMVREFQSVIGKETRAQIMEKEGRLPDILIACVGGGSNALGLFHEFLDDSRVRMFGVEAGGNGPGPGMNSATLSLGTPGVLHGSYSYLLQDDHGQVLPAHSIAPGLDYPGVGPEHSFLKDSGRVTYAIVSDEEAIEAFLELSKLEGIIPALEPAHALAFVKKLAGELESDTLLVVNLSGRGDKDADAVTKMLE
jgi:tryptophan synthase beta chain